MSEVERIIREAAIKDGMKGQQLENYLNIYGFKKQKETLNFSIFKRIVKGVF